MSTGDNRAIVGGGYYVSQLLGNALALTVLIFGLMALYAYLADSRVSVLALGALVLSIFGIALQLIGLGVFAFAIPALSRSFLDGHSESINILDYIFEGPFRIVVLLALLLYVAGFILLGRGHGRSPCAVVGLRTFVGCGPGRGRVAGAHRRRVDRPERPARTSG